MRKIIISLIIILALIYAALSIINPNKDYASEKLFYRAQKTLGKIRINPDVAPPAMIESVTKDLRAITERYPETGPAKLAYMSLADIYISDKKYDEAVTTLDSLISSGDKDKPLLSRAHFLKALVYEKQGKWNEALKQFEILKDKYTSTPLGLQSPLYVAQYYVKNGKSAEAEREFDRAVQFYQKIENENKGTVLGYASSSLLIQAFIGSKKYDEAGSALEDIIINYPTALTLIQQLPYVELVYVKLLNRPDKAIGIYDYIIKETKDEKLIKFLEEKIEGLKKPKEKE